MPDAATETARIEELSEANRRARDPELERELLRLRYQAGVELCREATGGEPPEPDFDALDVEEGQLPEVTPDQLTPELLRAAILSRGALWIRGLVSADECAELVKEIDRAFDAREEAVDNVGPDGYYEQFTPDGRDYMGRGLVREGGIWPADSPKLMFDMLETFERAGLQRVAHAYLGEPPALSIQKSTLRRVDPNVGHGHAGWHQDGAFLGDVRALNVWLSLSHCGDDAPGLDLVPRRFDHIVPTGTEGAVFDWVVSPKMVEEVAADSGVLRPIFEVGDVLLFDELFLHASGTGPSMSKVRYAIESWFFGPSAFPERYTPLAA